MLPWDTELAGRLDRETIDSTLLRGNPLGDPHERPLWVYTPPEYFSSPETQWPTVYVIQGYTGHLAMWNNRSPYRQPRSTEPRLWRRFLRRTTPHLWLPS